MTAEARIGLVACSASKLERVAAARDLYTGALFRKARAYAEATCAGWYVLSAKHGLLVPSTRVEPYNSTLRQLTAVERVAWGKRVAASLCERVGQGSTVVLLAGRLYRDALPEWLWGRFTREDPLSGCRGIGEQMQRLDRLLGAPKEES